MKKTIFVIAIMAITLMFSACTVDELNNPKFDVPKIVDSVKTDVNVSETSTSVVESSVETTETVETPTSSVEVPVETTPVESASVSSSVETEPVDSKPATSSSESVEKPVEKPIASSSTSSTSSTKPVEVTVSSSSSSSSKPVEVPVETTHTHNYVTTAKHYESYTDPNLGKTFENVCIVEKSCECGKTITQRHTPVDLNKDGVCDACNSHINIHTHSWTTKTETTTETEVKLERHDVTALGLDRTMLGRKVEAGELPADFFDQGLDGTYTDRVIQAACPNTTSLPYGNGTSKVNVTYKTTTVYTYRVCSCGARELVDTNSTSEVVKIEFAIKPRNSRCPKVWWDFDAACEDEEVLSQIYAYMVGLR